MNKRSSTSIDETQATAVSGKYGRKFIYKPGTSFVAIPFILLHIPLVLLMNEFAIISTLHAVFTLLIGLLWLSDKKPIRVIYVTTYISGVEILWRATSAGVFYEYGKYSIALLLILAILKYRRLEKASKLPVLFFLLFLPSMFVLPYFNREDLSFNLSGPFVLAVSTMFFSTVQLTQTEVKRMLEVLIAPIVGMTFLATFYTLSIETIEFTGESLDATSGFTGPNQVATILGLGAISALYYTFIERENIELRNIMVVLSIWMFSQSLLTFSRGGLWTAFGALLIGFYFLYRKNPTRSNMLVLVVIFTLLMIIIILPLLNQLTGGLLINRFQDFETTGRSEIIQSDLYVFNKNPLLGVGPGQSYYHHSLFFRESQAHTEYSRMLAEHGIFGILAIFILIFLTAKRFLSRSSAEQKSFSCMFTSWALLTMFHSAMRLAAPGFVFGLAEAEIVGVEEPIEENNKNQRRYPSRKGIFTPTSSKYGM